MGKPGNVPGDDSGFVGEVDGQGFGVGVAPPGVKPNVSTLVSTRKVKSRNKGKERDSAKNLLSQVVRDRVMDKKVVRDRIGFSHPRFSHLLTPPPKSQAFEEFKQERGSEINRILNQNKGKVFAIYSQYTGGLSHSET